MRGLTRHHREVSSDAFISVAAIASPPPRLAWLDPARAVAILFVLAYHSLGYLSLPSRFHGEAGVDAFLLLSGFGLAYGTRAEPWIGFAWRRLKRLLPAYWIVLGLCALDLWAHGLVLSWRQVVMHVTCLHLIWGDDYAFGISMSYWFIGLIVPLYVWFALLRPWIVRGQGYAALGISLAVAAAGGMLLLKQCPGWGGSSLGHAPHRLPQFFLGAIAGLAYSRRDSIDKLVTEPLLILGVTVFMGVVVYFDWSGVPFGTLAGTGIIAVGMLAAHVGGRCRIGWPLLTLLSVVGCLAYELYLCHQYLIVTVLDRDLSPRLAAWLPKVPIERREVIVTIVGFAAALWLAWALRWTVSFRDSKRNWRATIIALCVLTATSALATSLLARAPRPPRTRTFELTITLPEAPQPPCVEPIIYFGAFRRTDLISLQHDGKGQGRFRIDHSGEPPLYSGWVSVGVLTSGKVNVTINGDYLELRSAGVTLRSTVAPYAPRAYPVVGINDLNLTEIELKAKSTVVKSPVVVRSKG